MLLGNNYSETYSQSSLETIHKPSSVREYADFYSHEAKCVFLSG